MGGSPNVKGGNGQASRKLLYGVKCIGVFASWAFTDYERQKHISRVSEGILIV